MYGIIAMLIWAGTMICFVILAKKVNFTVNIKYEVPEAKVVEAPEVQEEDTSVTIDDLLKEVNAFILDDDEVNANG